MNLAKYDPFIDGRSTTATAGSPAPKPGLGMEMNMDYLRGNFDGLVEPGRQFSACSACPSRRGQRSLSWSKSIHAVSAGRSRTFYWADGAHAWIAAAKRALASGPRANGLMIGRSMPDRR